MTRASKTWPARWSGSSAEQPPHGAAAVGFFMRSHGFQPSNHQCQQQKEYLRVMRQWIGHQKQSKWIELLQASYNYSQSMSIKVSINVLETEVRSLRYKDALAGKPPYGRSSHDTDKLFDVALAMLALSVEQVWWREVPYVNPKPYGPNSQLQLSVKYLPLAAYLAICIKPTWRDIWGRSRLLLKWKYHNAGLLIRKRNPGPLMLLPKHQLTQSDGKTEVSNAVSGMEGKYQSCRLTSCGTLPRNEAAGRREGRPTENEMSASHCKALQFCQIPPKRN